MTFDQLYVDWYPEYYDYLVTETDDIELIKETLKQQKGKKIFEICCGTGRILIPLAEAGYEMHGIDIDNHLLKRLFGKADKAGNIVIRKGDAITAGWGENYDVVIMAGNIIINIEYSKDYKEAQKLFIKKSYEALKPGGYLLMDNAGYFHPENIFKSHPEPRTFGKFTDSNGTHGRHIFLWSTYDLKTQISRDEVQFELTAKTGETFVKNTERLKHIPLIPQMTGWVEDAGFEIINLWGDHQRNPVTESTHRTVYWARKPE